MCGIAGYVSWDSPPDTAVLRAMEKSLAHRGPDEGSIWCDRICGLAHRRLRIIDLSPLAAQPMSNETGKLTVILNGEIYNFLELRRELETLGHTFKSRSDTEVLLHGYESWGENLFKKLRGMFALALWDQPNEQLIFGRDRADRIRPSAVGLISIQEDPEIQADDVAFLKGYRSGNPVDHHLVYRNTGGGGIVPVSQETWVAACLGDKAVGESVEVFGFFARSNFF